MKLFFKAWSNARFSANDAGSSSSQRGRRAKSHVGQSIASLICFLKLAEPESATCSGARFHAFMQDRVREDSVRRKVRMDTAASFW